MQHVSDSNILGHDPSWHGEACHRAPHCHNAIFSTLPHCLIATLQHCHLPCCQTGRKWWQEPRRRAGEKRSAFQNQPLLGHKNHCSSNNLKLGMWRRQSGLAIGVLERPEPVGDPRCNRRKTNLRQIVKSRRVATVYKENANSRSW